MPTKLATNANTPDGPVVVVGAAIFDKQDRILLVRGPRKFAGRWTVPGGKVQRRETLEDALRREILEETRLHLEGIVLLGVRELIEGPDHFVFVEFSARVANSAAVHLNAEATEFAWFAPEALNEAQLAPSVAALVRERLGGLG